MENERPSSECIPPRVTALRDVARPPLAGLPVREEPLRTTRDLRPSSAIPLSAWRGRSGQRYVVGVHALTAADPEAWCEAVVLAVRRDRAGRAEVVELAAGEADEPGPRPAAFADRARERGATEFHVHRLAADAVGRRAVLADLS